jgi:uncharacterized membrane protein YkgB
MKDLFESVILFSAKAGGFGLNFTRFACALVLIWIGGLKFFPYEADGIVPFVANSPLMSYFYKTPLEYKSYGNKEGELVPANRKWNTENRTYSFANGLGVLLVVIGILLLWGYWNAYAGFAGSLLLIIMSLGTSSFLITTGECWVPNLGDGDYGFPMLSAKGRLVIKDIIMLGAAILLLSESAKAIIKLSYTTIMG